MPYGTHMSITEVTADVVTAPLHTEFVTALRRTADIETVVVTVHDSDGDQGRGEAPQTWRITGQSLAGARACALGPLQDALIGRDPLDLNDCLDRVDEAVVGNSAAKAALDVALHDLWARKRGLPLVEALGGTATSLPTVVTLAAGDAEQLAEAAAARVAEGFSALKVKVGLDPAGDLARLAAIRQAVGPRVTIRIDANQGWTPKQSVRIISGMEDADLGIELVEQPTPAHDIEGLAFVTSAVGTTILADESVHGVRDLSQVIVNRAADAVNVKLAKCGGLRTARTLLELARQHDIGTTVGSMMEGPIGVAAISSLAAAVGVSITSDLDAAWWLSKQDSALRYSNGALQLTTGPGLSNVAFAT
ncbi:L-alanine-DL-glutamate epimerase-like enolase superfamily enzyme [Stackebrandtia endophytica]|uniref:Dipeptide epimerase n=2 Tax=Stackebrandtia endophytica TaxID=1496996 RepID=A0A543B412_9ACTN|nr:L-alanine-DL-glutamate epimerase-like enolase superfamily enzyme [Stackebrandtia endophytica]